MTTSSRVLALLCVLAGLTLTIGCASNAATPDPAPRQDTVARGDTKPDDGKDADADDMTRPTETPSKAEDDMFGGAVKMDDESAFAADTGTAPKKAPPAEPVADAPPARPELVIGTPLVAGELDRTEVETKVRRFEKQLTACFEPYIANKGGAGSMIIAFGVKPSGSLENIKVAKSTLGDKGVDACVTKVFESVIFPVRKNVKPILVQFPLLLSVP